MYMHEQWSPLYTPIGAGLFGFALPFIIVGVVVTIVLKGYALWHAARGSQKWWFIALLIINSMGILEIIYLLFFRPNAPYEKTIKNSNHDHSSHEHHNHEHHTHPSSDSSSAA